MRRDPAGSITYNGKVNGIVKNWEFITVMIGSFFVPENGKRIIILLAHRK